MSTYHAGACDVAVIGAGHAGIEAALAAARARLAGQVRFWQVVQYLFTSSGPL